ncbi:hypothetical protein MNBD_GAMMA07-490 [hydrothermal vent metagenome]|uniref:Uncharacterized protein n=1 Tax=hydrothermal vent metagenome TaxID=652676 RepID=A0A3B0WJC4_9ZZZZ
MLYDPLMKIICSFIVFAVLGGQSLIASANQPLSRQLVDLYIIATEKLDAIEAKYPDVFAKSDEFTLSQEPELIAFFEASKAYPEIKSMLIQSDFSNIKHYFDISTRIMGGVFSEQSSKLPLNLRSDNLLKGLDNNIKKFKNQGISAELIKIMEDELLIVKNDMAEMQLMIKRTSLEDKTFVKKNFKWMQSHLPFARDKGDNNENKNN